VNGVRGIALLDTGSTVSTISQSFYMKHFFDTPLHELNNILDIECAGGQLLPYSGYIVIQLAVAGFPHEQSLLLVVPDSNYNSLVPLLLGTNILSHCMTKCHQVCGDKMLQHHILPAAWNLAFRSLKTREQQLKKNKHRLGMVKSAEGKNIVLQANSSAIVQGYIDKKLEYHPTCAMLQATKKATISEDVDITPALIAYHCHSSGLVQVHLSNLTTRPIIIPARAVLCEIQPVNIEEIMYNDELHNSSEPESSPLLEKLKIPSLDLKLEEIQRLKQLISQYEDIFSVGDDDIGHNHDVKHRIDLTDDAPFKQRHRRIPPAMIDEVRSHLQQLLAAGVIRKSHSPWASNMVLARKR